MPLDNFNDGATGASVRALLNTALDAVATPHDAGRAYKAGDRVTYDQQVLRANGPIPAGTPITLGTGGATWTHIVASGAVPYDVRMTYQRGRMVTRGNVILQANGHVPAHTAFALDPEGNEGATWRVVAGDTTPTNSMTTTLTADKTLTADDAGSVFHCDGDGVTITLAAGTFDLGQWFQLENVTGGVQYISLSGFTQLWAEGSNLAPSTVISCQPSEVLLVMISRTEKLHVVVTDHRKQYVHGEYDSKVNYVSGAVVNREKYAWYESLQPAAPHTAWNPDHWKMVSPFPNEIAARVQNVYEDRFYGATTHLSMPLYQAGGGDFVPSPVGIRLTSAEDVRTPSGFRQMRLHPIESGSHEVEILTGIHGPMQPYKIGFQIEAGGFVICRFGMDPSTGAISDIGWDTPADGATTDFSKYWTMPATVTTKVLSNAQFRVSVAFTRTQQGSTIEAEALPAFLKVYPVIPLSEADYNAGLPWTVDFKGIDLYNVDVHPFTVEKIEWTEIPYAAGVSTKAGFNPLAYSIGADDIMRLRGNVETSSVQTNNRLLGTLPEGARPKHSGTIIIVANGGTVASATIASDGGVIANNVGWGASIDIPYSTIALN